MQWRDLQNREGFLISKAFKFPYDLLTQYWMEEPVNKGGAHHMELDTNNFSSQ